MKKFFKPLLIFSSILLLSGCSLFDTVVNQSEKNHKDTMDWLHERADKNSVKDD
ncbi:hypothetical protein ABFY60_26785 [Lysinibacillus pakistanensis]|uniref:hypothetical protein n=1 Tax=Lysinibacillus pakistanensis TaxID=759811 RepID=UPI003D2A61CB